ncbi:hypothetical protein [Rickettsia oklahomensis]|uniref:Uncharacterized protein n=1 Tax=Rickettsia oklahomensis TaxID=3141789 RepID=A0AAU7BZ29_9RICK
MKNEIAYNFLYNIDKFKIQFQRVLDRTPHERAPGKIDFWAHFFLGSGITIQNSKDAMHIRDICFSIGSFSKARIIKLAFKVNDNGQDKVILRSISITENNTIPNRVKYADNELKIINNQFFGADANTINLANIDSKTLHLNIKTSTINLQFNNALGIYGSSVNIVQVKPLQGVKLDDVLDLIANSKNVIKDNVESFFNKLIELYNNNKGGVLIKSEVAYHGFTYGALVLNYKNKYGIDTYVEQSAGRGFLDLYFLLRKDGKDNHISDAVKIIVEFKGGQQDVGNSIISVVDAVKQIEDMAYAYQLVGRTTYNKEVIIVGVDFGAIIQKVYAQKAFITQKEGFISTLINRRQIILDHDTITKALKTIYYSTRSDESLGVVILGELLSTNVEKKIFVIKDLPSNQRVSIFVFSNQYKSTIILTIIEQEHLNSFGYERTFIKDKSKPTIRSNIDSKQVTIEEEVQAAILYTQKELNINAGKRIDITINPKGKVFESIRNVDFYCLNIRVNDLESTAPQVQQSYISQFITEYNVVSNIDLNNLIPALQNLDLDNMSSPPHGDNENIEAQSRELTKLKEELLKLKKFIVLEKDFKSIIHGLFLHKKFNGNDITVLTEVSLGHGRADLVLVFQDRVPLALELGLGTLTQIRAKETQLKDYIRYLKVITDAVQIKGVVLCFNKDTTIADSIIVAKGVIDKVYHISSDDSPVKQSPLRSRPNLQDLNNPQPGSSGLQQEKHGYNSDSGSTLNPRQKKLKLHFSSCLGGKKKREISFCKFSEEDLAEFSIRKKMSNIDELQIDSKKFLEYLIHSNDQGKNSQLLELAKIRQIEDSNNIIGHYKYLLDRVIEDGGYNNYRQNERLERIIYNVAQDNSIKINSKLKSKLISAVGKLQLIRGIYGAIVQCQESKDNDTGGRDCLINVGGVTYSFASEPIENIIVRQKSKWGIRLLNSVSQVTPKILGHNTKFIFKILSAKYGVNFLKGTAGGVSGVFDIVDIGLVAQALKKCNDMADTDNACSDKEIRDYTASIVFSGVSFVSGVALVVASTNAGLGVGAGLLSIAAYAIYSGISDIVEYEARYDTTHNENWRIFWHTVTNKYPPEDVQHLAARIESVNNILSTTWDYLQSMPNDVVAYAGGFGKVVIRHWEECTSKLKFIRTPYGGGGQIYVTECKKYISSTVKPSYAKIDMLHNNYHYLSRVVPNYIQGATMTCLPQQASAIYEVSGTARSDPNVIYPCANSFIVEHNVRRNQVHDNKYIIFNTKLISAGEIITHNTLSSIFMLGESSIKIDVLSRNNQFIFLNNKFLGSINLGIVSLNHIRSPYSFNTFNTAILDYSIVKFSIQSIEHIDWISGSRVNIFINDRKINLFYTYFCDVIKIAYQGRRNNVDHVDCKLNDRHPFVKVDLIDGDGGYSNDKPDIIKGCRKVVIWPYTEVKGTEGIYYFYIRTRDIKKKNSNSLIDIKGKGTIVFLGTNLLTDCESITYSKINNTLSLQIKLGANIFYTLSIKNYLGNDNITHNFNLIDKNYGNVIPKIEESTTSISRFELHITKEHSSQNSYYLVEEVKKYYDKVSAKNTDYELYGVVKYKEHYYHFGSESADIIIFDKQIAFAKGCEESDIYIVTNNIDVGTIIIDNSSHDMKFDILLLLSIDNVWLETAGNDLNVLIHKKKDDVEKVDNVIIYNYFKDVSYKHLIFVDEKGDAYIPFQGVDNNLRLVSFCSCNISSFFSVITANTTVVIDCTLDNIVYYRIQEDLILHSRSSDSPVIIAKQFFDNQVKYNYTKIYQYISHNSIMLLEGISLNDYLKSDSANSSISTNFNMHIEKGTFVLKEHLGNNPIAIKFHDFMLSAASKIQPLRVICIMNEGVHIILRFTVIHKDKMFQHCNNAVNFAIDGNDLLLLAKDTSSHYSIQKITMPQFYIPLSEWYISIHRYKMLNNYNEQPLDFVGGANRAKAYTQLVQESYNVAIQEYEIDFSKSFNITHNHRMDNGKLFPIPLDEQRIGIIIFKDIKPREIKVMRFIDDLVINNVHITNSDKQHIIRVKNWFINHDYTISTIEFDFGLDYIRINAWNQNINTTKGNTTLVVMQNKISMAEWMTDNLRVCMQALLSPNYDILYHHLKCILAISSKNSIIISYKALGFNLPEEQVTFIDNCKFTKDILSQLKVSINTTIEYQHCVGCNYAVLPTPNMSNNILACAAWYRLILFGYNYIEASQIYNNISQIFNYSRIIESINRIQNILGNNSDETDHQRHHLSFNDYENLIISTTNWFKEKVYVFWNMISNINILPVANADPINESLNMYITGNCDINENKEWKNTTINSNNSIAVQYNYVQQQLPLIQYVVHHSQLVPTIKKYGVMGTIKHLIRQCENQLSSWYYYHQDTRPDHDAEQFCRQICSCTNLLNKLEGILIEMRTQWIKSQMSSVLAQCVSAKENITPKHKLLNYVESALQGEGDSRLLNDIETKLGELDARWQKKYKFLKSYHDSIQDTKDELYQLTVKLQQQKTVTQNQIEEITILVNYTTDLIIGIMDLTNNSVWQQQLQQILLVHKYGINTQQDIVEKRVELNTSNLPNNVDINISASGDMDHILAYMSHILPDQLGNSSIGSMLLGLGEPPILA